MVLTVLKPKFVCYVFFLVAVTPVFELYEHFDPKIWYHSWLMEIVPFYCKFLWWMETDLSILSNSSNEKILSWWVILNALSARMFIRSFYSWVRLNYTTTHHDPPPSTTTHHQPKYVHHHPPPAKIYPPLPTISQKMDHHPAKAKIYWYITPFRHCFNSFFFFEMQYSFPWWRFCVIKFWSVRFSNSKFLLHSAHFTILKIF